MLGQRQAATLPQQMTQSPVLQAFVLHKANHITDTV